MSNSSINPAHCIHSGQKFVDRIHLDDDTFEAAADATVAAATVAAATAAAAAAALEFPNFPLEKIKETATGRVILGCHLSV